MSNKSIQNTAIGLACGAFAIGAVVLFALSVNKNTDVYTEGADTVRKIQQLDTNWSMEAVKVKSNPLADFDSLAAFIPKLNLLKDNLKNTVLAEEEMSDRFANNINAYISQLDAKEEQIERFKSGYAIVRNSERYLPLAAGSVVQLAQNSNNYALSGEITGLVNDVKAYLGSPSDAEKSRLQLTMDSLLERSIRFEPNLSSGVANLISHGKVLMESSTPTERLFEEATSSKTADEAEQLMTGFSTLGDKVSRVKRNYQYGALGSLLLALLAGMALLFSRSPKVSSPTINYSAGGDDATPLSGLGSSTKGSEISYQIFAGMIGDDMVRAIGQVKIDADKLREHSRRLHDSLAVNARDDVSEVKQLTAEGTEVAAVAEMFNREELPALVQKMEESYQGVLRLAKRLTDYAGKENDEDQEWVNINDAVREVVLPANYNNDATVNIRLGDIPHILASPKEIKYLLKNIVDNAIAAVQMDDKEQATIKVETQMMEGHIGVTVTDNGVGIEPKKRKFLTQLFKPDGGGKLDLGIPSANYLVKRYGGKLLLNSVPGKGTAVRIMLPQDRETVGAT